MADSNIEILKKETYLKTIENSVGSRLFNSLIVRYKDSGKLVDVLGDGEYSCAVFVSSILVLSQMMDKPSATVKKVRESLGSSDNWKKVDIEQIEAGDIVFYEKTTFNDNSEHAHVGFILNKDEVVSTDYKSKMIARHKLNYRPIEVIYRYSF